MKLKKIASLLLAGVMAVSMLAGCSSSSSNDVTTDVDEEAATTYSSTLYGYLGNKAQGKVTAVENTDLTTALAAAVANYGRLVDYSEATTNFSWVSKLWGSSDGKQIEDYVLNAMEADGTQNEMVALSSDGESFKVVSVGVIGGGVSDSYALKSVVSDSDSFNNNIAGLATDDDNYDRSYTISASIVSSTDSNGVSVKFVAVMVSGTITAA